MSRSFFLVVSLFVGDILLAAPPLVAPNFYGDWTLECDSCTGVKSVSLTLHQVPRVIIHGDEALARAENRWRLEKDALVVELNGSSYSFRPSDAETLDGVLAGTSTGVVLRSTRQRRTYATSERTIRIPIVARKGDFDNCHDVTFFDAERDRPLGAYQYDVQGERFPPGVRVSVAKVSYEPGFVGTIRVVVCATAENSALRSGFGTLDLMIPNPSGSSHLYRLEFDIAVGAPRRGRSR